MQVSCASFCLPYCFSNVDGDSVSVKEMFTCSAIDEAQTLVHTLCQELPFNTCVSYPGSAAIVSRFPIQMNRTRNEIGFCHGKRVKIRHVSIPYG